MKSRETPVLRKVTRADSIPLPETFIDEDGFLHDTPIVTSIGIFEYSLPGGGTRKELRLPEHVFDRESLASYAGKPVIITHEAGSIDKDNVMDEIVGTVLSEGIRDGDSVRVKIVIHDIDRVKEMPYRELSLGYSLDLVEEPGVWNGKPYDAVQTNIRINHLAIVEKARAGEQAHLNLDGKDAGFDDKKKTEGGTGMENRNEDSIDMTPEELLEAVKNYRALKDGDGGTGTPEDTGHDGKPEENPAAQEPSDIPAGNAGELPEDPAPVDAGAEQDGDVDALISAVKELLTVLKEGQHGNGQPPTVDNADGSASGGSGCQDCSKDGSEDMAGSMNHDSADELFRQRLSICRIGDRLNLDGLENKSILDGKKEIIKKVLPDMRLDGKGKAYIDAAYDIAVEKACGRKDVGYQRQQMTSGGNRADSREESMAAQARQRMIDRNNKEGGGK